MAVPVSIEMLLHQGVVESSRIEFEEGFNPARIIRTICAFANDIDNIGGGYVVIGVNEIDGAPQLPPVGLPSESIDKIQKKLLEYCSRIEPHYLPVCEPVLYQGRQLLVIWAKGGYGRPYRAPSDVTSKHSDYFYYIRKMASTVKADEMEIKELYSISETIPYDDRPNLLASPDDLDKDLLISHLKAVGSSLGAQAPAMSLRALARNMQLLSGPPEMEYPINAALLFFSRNPERYFQNARIEVVHIPDLTGMNAGMNMEEKTFSGPVQHQVRNALQYIQNTVLTEKIVKNDQRAEADRFWNYPLRAIEEILSSAIYHKSYQIHEPVTVWVENSQIVIKAPSGFDWSVEDADEAGYRIRSRYYRNRRIGGFLKELHLIEGCTTGFSNAIKALQENGSDLLKFEYDEQRQFLSVIIPIHPSFIKIDKKLQKQLLYQDAILSALKENPMSLTNLARSMGYKGITGKLKKNVESLVAEGKIIYSVGEKGEVLLTVS